MRSPPARQIKISNKETHRVSETAGNEHRSQPTLHMSLSSHECLGSDLKEDAGADLQLSEWCFCGRQLRRVQDQHRRPDPALILGSLPASGITNRSGCRMATAQNETARGVSLTFTPTFAEKSPLTIQLDRSNLPCKALCLSRSAASHRLQHLLPSCRRRDGFRAHSFSVTRLLGPTC